MLKKQIRIKNLNINYRVSGQGKPFLILHGWGSNSEKWEKVINLLSFKFQVFAPDLPGFGESEVMKDPWQIKDFIDFLKEFVEKLDLKNFYLLGHSFGGSLALKYNSEFKVNKLFLVAPSLVRKNTLKKRIFSLKIPCPFFCKKIIYALFLKNTDYPLYRGAMKETLKNVLIDLSHLKPLSETILIWGKKDKITPFSNSKLIKKDVLETIPQAGHAIEIDTPDLLVEKILNNL
ncbi:MAG: alpha/beta hydrolase [Candidatus Pacebacteria bacterium]|nr:alpha/beta hydrolase [Candidatus Paceibacterota bacterium]